MTDSGIPLQLCGDWVCAGLKPAADNMALKTVEAMATPMALPVRAVVAIMPAAAPILSCVTAPRVAL